MHSKIIAKHAHVTEQDLLLVLVTDQSYKHCFFIWYTKANHSLPQNIDYMSHHGFFMEKTVMLTVPATAKGTSDLNLQATSKMRIVRNRLNQRCI